MATALVAKPAPPSEPEKQTQKAILKRFIDPVGPYVNYLQGYGSAPWLQPTMAGALQLLPPHAYRNCPISSITNKFVHCNQNRTRCAVNCVNWTPDGRRCMTGDNIGQITLWNSNDFKLEQMLQSHDKGVRHLTHTHNGQFFFSCDDLGVIRIYTPKFMPLFMIKAHDQSCRAVSVAPSNTKFASCSDNGAIRLWDLATCTEEREFRGHGSDVKFVDWHPTSSLLATAGRDAMIKLWDARDDPASASITTLTGHKQGVNQVRWNLNGSWLLSTSKDATVKVWDIRHTKREMQSWQGHTRDIFCAAWHPIHLELLVSGGNDGALFFWMVGQQSHVATVEKAHDNNILGLAFHPNGHMLASSSMESFVKFWVRQRPGDPWRGALDTEQDDASTYADLLAAATTGGAAAAAAAGGGVLGVAAGGQLPGGIAVQLPGLGGIPGLGAPTLPGVRPPGPPRLPGVPPAAAAAGGPVVPPGLGVPPHAAGAPGSAVPGSGQAGPPGFPGLPGLGMGPPSGAGVQGIPGLAGGLGLAAGMGQQGFPRPPGIMPGVRPQGQQHMAGMKRQRESDGDSHPGSRHQQGGRAGRGFGGYGRGQGFGGHQQQQQQPHQQQHDHHAGGRGGGAGYGRGGGFGRGFAGRGDMQDGRGGGRAGQRGGGFAGRGQMRGAAGGGNVGRGGRGSYGDRRGH